MPARLFFGQDAEVAGRDDENGKKKAGLFDLRTYEEVLRGMNLEEPIIFYRHDMGLLNPLLS